jgi:hypothetical protein
MSGSVPPRPDLPPAPGRRPLRRGRRLVAAALGLFVLVAALDVLAVAVLSRNAQPKGDPSSFAFLRLRADGTPVRWDPCVPLRYEVNPSNAPEGGVEAAQEAVARVADAVGIQFVYEGTTDRTPEEQEDASYVSTEGGTFGVLPVLIAWLPADLFRRYASPRKVLALGIGRPGGEHNDQFVSGMIVVNADQSVPVAWVGRYSLGPILMHEWGHVLGLAHVDDPEQLMWSEELGGDPHAVIPNLGQTGWGAGDLAGLEQVGMDAGCLTDPSP